MRTAAKHAGRGVAALLLDHIITEARTRAYHRLSLETGAAPSFAPAQRLYARHGFTPCAPFSHYTGEPHSNYLTRTLR
jgi:putative acetyltransferase